MYTGRPEDQRRKEQQAAALAAEIAQLMTRIDALGIGQCLPGAGRIAGPGFDIRRTPSQGWTAWSSRR
ncbi:hypothetical protein AB0O42_35550 [Streptomyces sp. NPDC089922]|uniref:hypothetical protein n=1 Tax=Streptomyces sp. NPDC089922 TaxID=3155189 RepID=UPI003426738B